MTEAPHIAPLDIHYSLPVRGVRLAICSEPRHSAQSLRMVFRAPKGTPAAHVHLLAAIMERGTKSFPTMRDFTTECDRLYGANLDWDAFRDGDGMCLGLTVYFVAPRAVSDRKYEGEVWHLLRESLLEPAFLDPAFDAKLFDVEKTNYGYFLKHLQTDPSASAMLSAFKALLKGDPLAVPFSGTPEQLEGLTLNKLRRLYGRIVCKGRALAVSDGPVEVACMESRLSGFLGNGARSGRRIVAPFTPPGTARRVREEGRGEGDQIAVFFALERGFKCTRAELNAAVGVMSSGSQSRLYMKLREGSGLAYGNGEFVSPDKRLFAILSSVLPGRGSDAVNLIKREFRTAARDLREEELAALKREVRAAMLKDLDSPSRISRLLLITSLRGKKFNPASSLARSESVKCDRVKAVIAALRPFGDYVARGSERTTQE
ncbi:MAG: insulinase family protein [Candidatus Brocadiia bacterium]